MPTGRQRRPPKAADESTSAACNLQGHNEPDPALLTLLPQSSDDVPEHTFYREDVDGEGISFPRVEYPGPVGISFSAAPWHSSVLEWGCKSERTNFDYTGDAAAIIPAYYWGTTWLKDAYNLEIADSGLGRVMVECDVIEK